MTNEQVVAIMAAILDAGDKASQVERDSDEINVEQAYNLFDEVLKQSAERNRVK